MHRSHSAKPDYVSFGSKADRAFNLSDELERMKSVRTRINKMYSLNEELEAVDVDVDMGMDGLQDDERVKEGDEEEGNGCVLVGEEERAPSAEIYYEQVTAPIFRKCLETLSKRTGLTPRTPRITPRTPRVTPRIRDVTYTPRTPRVSRGGTSASQPFGLSPQRE
eukprot:TRINITY_DN30248_c0_g1_i2.p1 TRINITY_DN30248_c0_g1~~TRINITY_DN30248_c0_g1_i2.p1  ORF type:complete len:181 (+),score=34.96 TRINITY_DN30248_c0_g1_i2:49-543(+)